MYQKELDIAKTLARETGAVVMKHYNDSLVVESKTGVDNFDEPVTVADREASELIVRALAAAFPGDAILSEEEPDDADLRMSSERVWIIDPIDGTAGFIRRDGDFAIQIGLAVGGEPVVGAVYLPFHNVLYYASKGNGSFAERHGREIEKLQVAETKDLRMMTLAISRNHSNSNIRKVAAGLGIDKSIDRGSVGLKIGLVAEHFCDIYIHLSPRTKLWDTCGPQVIIEEAGGRLTDLYGHRYIYNVRDLQNWGGVLCSNSVVHDELISKLRPILNEMGRFPVRSKAA